MATRYCGGTKINIKFRDRYNDYQCTLVGHGTQYVGLPGAWATLPEYKNGVDSPEAYDSAAHAAISFALHDGMIDESDCLSGEDGHHIQRRPLGMGVKQICDGCDRNFKTVNALASHKRHAHKRIG